MSTPAPSTQLQQGNATLAMLTMLNLTSTPWPEDKGYKFDKPNSTEANSYYDFIVVGLGTSGCIIAEQLTKDRKFKVLGIEAGGMPNEASMDPGLINELPKSPFNWNFTSKYDACAADQFEGNVFRMTSGKILGGDSSINYMVYARGDKHDFQLMAKTAKDPSYDYNHMLKYFMRSERLEDKEVLNSTSGKYYGKNGSVGMARQPHDINKKYLKAFKEMNKNILLDTNGKNTLGYAQPMFLISNGSRQSMALTSLSRASNRSNLDVIYNTKVTLLVLNKKNKVIGVQAKRANGEVISIKAKKEVILCAGSLKTPQILLLSGIGVKEELQHLRIPVKANLPVGKNLADHIGVLITLKLNITTHTPMPFDPHKFPSPTIIGYDTLHKEVHYPEYRNRIFINPSGSDTLYTQCAKLYSFKKSVCKSLYNQTKGYEAVSIKIGQLHSNSRGQVTLRSSDPDDDPVIDPGYLTNKQDLEDTVDYIIKFLKVKDTETLKKYNAEIVYPDLPDCDTKQRGSREYFLCYVSKLATPMYDKTGTCSMGSVVDNRMKIKGVQGVRVADASTIANSPSGGVQAQTMALANKAADMIKEDNKGYIIRTVHTVNKVHYSTVRSIIKVRRSGRSKTPH